MRANPWHLGALLLAAALAVGAVLVWWPTGAPAPRPVASTEAPDPGEVLSTWDAAREECWARSDPACLAELYVPGSRAGREDVALLRRWEARGVVVATMERQVLRLEVLRSSSDERAYRVTDRLSGGTVRSGEVTRSLPATVSRTREVTLVRAEGRWVVRSVREAG